MTADITSISKRTKVIAICFFLKEIYYPEKVKFESIHLILFLKANSVLFYSKFCLLCCKKNLYFRAIIVCHFTTVYVQVVCLVKWCNNRKNKPFSLPVTIQPNFGSGWPVYWQRHVIGRIHCYSSAENIFRLALGCIGNGCLIEAFTAINCPKYHFWSKCRI